MKLIKRRTRLIMKGLETTIKEGTGNGTEKDVHNEDSR